MCFVWLAPYDLLATQLFVLRTRPSSSHLTKKKKKKKKKKNDETMII